MGPRELRPPMRPMQLRRRRTTHQPEETAKQTPGTLREPGLVTHMDHGTTHYDQGCRHPRCVQAHRHRVTTLREESLAARVAALIPEPPPEEPEEPDDDEPTEEPPL